MSNIDDIFNKAQQEISKESLKLNIPNVPIEDQKYVLINFIEDNKGNQVMKIWGTFASQEEADKQAELVKGRIGNEAFDTFVVEMYGLATRPPKKEEIVQQKYHENELQKPCR